MASGTDGNTGNIARRKVSFLIKKCVRSNKVVVGGGGFGSCEKNTK